MKLQKIADWLSITLRVADFDDVSNNGIQIARSNDDVRIVAFAVDASVQTVQKAAKMGAQLLVVHHGLSWGGGIRRITGGVYAVVKAALEADLAIYACHLPLDAHEKLGNNAQLAKLLGLRRLRKAFSYHGNVIGFVGVSDSFHVVTIGSCEIPVPRGKVGVCSGGAGEFAEYAHRLDCDLYVTGEASWGDVIAAENCGQKMICAGHYETEVFGVRAVSEALRKALRVQTLDLTKE